jgi:hypothetical protein
VTVCVEVTREPVNVVVPTELTCVVELELEEVDELLVPGVPPSRPPHAARGPIRMIARSAPRMTQR